MSRAVSEQEAAQLAYICCGRRLKQVQVDNRRSDMSFTYCDGCESMRWFRGDLPMDHMGSEAGPALPAAVPHG